MKPMRAAAARPPISRISALIAGLAIAALPVAAEAAGFGVDFEGANSLGTATAGSAAAADSSTIFYNPAGLGFLEHNEFLAGGQLFLLHDQFTNNGSTILGGAAPTPGNNGRDAIPATLVPWVFTSYRVNPELTVGLGIFSPFGLSTNYGSLFVGRYQNEITNLLAIDFNPSIAWRPVPWLSLGAGLDVQYVHVRLTQAIDFGSACAAVLGGATCGGGFGLTPGASDGQVDNSGDSVGYGFNVGALVEPIAGTRLGIAYRSTITQHISDGSQGFFVPTNARAFLTAGGMPLALTGSSISTDLPLPGRLSFGLRQTIAPGLDLLLDATLTLWSVFGSTSITASNPVTGSSVVINQNYQNAWRFATGLEYVLDDRWTLRTGVAYDQTPIPGFAIQAALPDADRVYLGAGVSARIDDRWSVDLGYSHVFYVKNVSIDRTASGATLVGSFSSGGDVLAAQLKVRY